MRVPKDPLLLFLVLGAALYAAAELFLRHGDAEASAIFVTQAQIDNVVSGFTRTWQRPPTQEERQGLIDDYVRDEVYYREALALGLDRDDTIIRRRLRQKLEFVAEDLATQAEPSDAELRAYLDAHPTQFQIDAQLSFVQIFLNTERRGPTLAADAAGLLALLNRDGSRADIATLGDATLLEQRFEQVSAAEVAQQFGDAFAANVSALSTGQWHGPIASTYGAHLVLVSARTSARAPALEEVRDAVKREYSNTKRQEASATFYRSLRQRYTVTFEP